MSNPNNCETCDYRKLQEPGMHCYMFREEPKAVCMKHSSLNEVFKAMRVERYQRTVAAQQKGAV
ncbi:MAG TPA: hypothetical protein VFM33_10060 [Aquabacterium sp.]|nr:hypothetical protein [Aquabacterium sp.]